MGELKERHTRVLSREIGQNNRNLSPIAWIPKDAGSSRKLDPERRPHRISRPEPSLGLRQKFTKLSRQGPRVAAARDWLTAETFRRVF